MPSSVVANRTGIDGEHPQRREAFEGMRDQLVQSGHKRDDAERIARKAAKRQEDGRSDKGHKEKSW